MNEKEKRLQEQRHMEANRKGLLGMEGKFGVILKHLGEPLIAHAGGWYGTSEMEDVWALPGESGEEDMPTFDEDEPVMEMGLHYNGLSSGLHLEIYYYHDAPDRGWRRLEQGGPGPGRELSVWWKGHLVFCESNDELYCYNPSHEWEDKIDYLFGIAKKRENKKYQEVIKESREQAQRDKLSWIERLRLRWGL
jgi:hypothetical protein